MTVRGTGWSGVWVQEQQHTNVYPIQRTTPNFTKHFIKIKILQFHWHAAIKKTNIFVLKIWQISQPSALVGSTETKENHVRLSVVLVFEVIGAVPNNPFRWKVKRQEHQKRSHNSALEKRIKSWQVCPKFGLILLVLHPILKNLVKVWHYIFSFTFQLLYYTSSVTVGLFFLYMYYYEVFRCFKSMVVLKSLPGQSFQRTAGPSGQLQVSNSIGEKKYRTHTKHKLN